MWDILRCRCSANFDGIGRYLEESGQRKGVDLTLMSLFEILEINEIRNHNIFVFKI